MDLVTDKKYKVNAVSKFQTPLDKKIRNRISFVLLQIHFCSLIRKSYLKNFNSIIKNSLKKNTPANVFSVFFNTFERRRMNGIINIYFSCKFISALALPLIKINYYGFFWPKFCLWFFGQTQTPSICMLFILVGTLSRRSAGTFGFFMIVFCLRFNLFRSKLCLKDSRDFPEKIQFLSFPWSKNVGSCVIALINANALLPLLWSQEQSTLTMFVSFLMTSSCVMTKERLSFWETR